MNDYYRLVFELLGIVGLVVAIAAEIDISRHRRDHERRESVRRSEGRGIEP